MKEKQIPHSVRDDTLAAFPSIPFVESNRYKNQYIVHDTEAEVTV
jgi:hypothetical protein